MSIIGSLGGTDIGRVRADREFALTAVAAIKKFRVREGRLPATAYLSLPVHKLYRAGTGPDFRTVVLPPGAKRQNPDLFYGVLMVDDAADAELII